MLIATAIGGTILGVFLTVRQREEKLAQERREYGIRKGDQGFTDDSSPASPYNYLLSSHGGFEEESLSLLNVDAGSTRRTKRLRSRK